MKAGSAETVVQLMVAKDPRRSVDTILEFLMGVNDAPAGAVFSVEEDGPRLFVGRGIAQDALDWAAECWKRERERLTQGRFSRSDERLLVPVRRGERLVALVFLKSIEADLGSLDEVTGLMGDAVARGARQAAASPIETYLEHTPAAEIERRKLLILLDRHEWNVARVARELGVTRTTVYKRLAEFGIPRKRVLKDGRSPRLAPVP